MKLRRKNSSMVELNEFIQIYEGALESDVCDFLVSTFDQHTNLHERHDNDGKPNFTQLNLTQNRNLSSEISNVHNHIIKKVIEYRDLYYEFVDKRVFPNEHAFEQFRIKKYNPDGEDRFDTHVDVVDHDSSRRFLSFLWYLNDVDLGGSTVFQDLTISPRKGKLVVFPPLWLFPHRGESPVGGSKYILTAYLHYK